MKQMWLSTQTCPVLRGVVPREVSEAVKLACIWFRKYEVVFLGAYANVYKYISQH